LSARPTAGGAAADALEPESDLDVLGGGQRRKQIESLEDEAEVPQPHRRQVPFGGPRHITAADDDAAARRLQDAAHDREQRGLATARRPEQQQHLAGVQRQIDAAQCMHGRPAHVVGLRDLFHGQQWCHVLTP
jgi:hypothetical protein